MKNEHRHDATGMPRPSICLNLSSKLDLAAVFRRTLFYSLLLLVVGSIKMNASCESTMLIFTSLSAMYSVRLYTNALLGIPCGSSAGIFEPG